MKYITIIGSMSKSLSFLAHAKNKENFILMNNNNLVSLQNQLRKGNKKPFIIFSGKYLKNINKKDLYNFFIEFPYLRAISHSESPLYKDLVYQTGIKIFISEGREMFKDLVPEIEKNLDNIDFGKIDITILEYEAKRLGLFKKNTEKKEEKM